MSGLNNGKSNIWGKISPFYWLRRMYDWTLRQSGSPHAPRALFGVAFIESSVFPIPPDVLLVAMTAARREKWLKYACICTAGSVLGALLGYSIGFFLYETAGKWIINTYNLREVISVIGRKYNENAFFYHFYRRLYSHTLQSDNYCRRGLQNIPAGAGVRFSDRQGRAIFHGLRGHQDIRVRDPEDGREIFRHLFRDFSHFAYRWLFLAEACGRIKK